MISMQTIVSSTFWVLGLAGLLATVSYGNWVRSGRQWTWARTLQTPLLLAPLAISLFFFSGGMALSMFFAAVPAPWWQMIAWSILAGLFGVQAVMYTRAGNRHGWETPIEGQGKHE